MQKTIYMLYEIVNLYGVDRLSRVGMTESLAEAIEWQSGSRQLADAVRVPSN